MDMDQLRAVCQEQGVPIMSPQSRSYIQAILQYRKPRHLLEIGTAVGFGTMLMAGQIQERGGHLTSFEISYPSYRRALHYTGQTGLYHTSLYQLDFLQVDLSVYITHPLDFVRVDGQKDQYPEYITKILPYLAPDAICLLDDVVKFPQTQDRIRQIVDTHHLRYQVIRLADDDGVGLIM